MANQKQSILLLGFGDIAQRLAGQLAREENTYAVSGLRRSQAVHPSARTIQGDVRNADIMANVLSDPYDVIVSTMTPSEYSDEGYKQAYVESTQCLLAVLSKQTWQPRLIIFVSSSGVYGQQDAEWVDENSPTEPSSYSGKRLLEAEHLLAASSYPHSVVRFSGIYGPGRQRLIEQVIDGEGAEKKPILYSNRIHADDCAGVLKHLIEKSFEQRVAELYLATDCEPAPLYDVKHWLASRLGLPSEHLQTAHLENKPLGRMQRSSKRCSNQRLLDSGYHFRYPTYREGYDAVLAEFDFSQYANISKDHL